MSDTQAVLAVNQTFYRAFEQKNLQVMSSVWLQGAGSICIHPGRPPLKGWEQIHFAWEQIFRNTEAFQIQTEVLTVETSGHLAYVVLAEKLVQVIQGRPIEVQSMATNVFQRMTNAWYLVLRHSSPILPPPGQQPGQPGQPGQQFPR